MTAIICKGDNILTIGRNCASRLSFGFKRYNGFAQEQGIHAEMSAILSLKNKRNYTTLIVFGTTRSGSELLTTRPCAKCMVSVKKAKITKIIFKENGTWKQERVARI